MHRTWLSAPDDRRVFEALRRLLEPRTQALDDVLVTNGELGGSRHGWLLERPAGNTPRDIKWMLKKHAWLVAQGVADWTLHEIHVNRMRQLAPGKTLLFVHGFSIAGSAKDQLSWAAASSRKFGARESWWHA